MPVAETPPAGGPSLNEAFRPRLSVVATARNDDHGGNLLGRMQIFVDGLVEQCARHALPAELLLVEWNPVAGRPPLAEALRFPERGPCAVRVVEVPNAVHARLKHAERLPLFQMIAKNVGIRRARAPFVLATNIDILFSDALVRYLAGDGLKRGRMYRVERYDVPGHVPPGVGVAAQLAFCEENVLRVNLREGTKNLKTGEYHGFYHLPTWRSRLREAAQDLGLLPVENRCRLHTNGCGDFTLLARGDWFALRGYAELEMFSFHLDSLFCFAAHHHGVREKVLFDPMRIYHIEHATGSGWTPEGEGKLNARIEKAGIEQLTPEAFDALAVQMRRERRALTWNPESWGMAELDLQERVPYAGPA